MACQNNATQRHSKADSRPAPRACHRSLAHEVLFQHRTLVVCTCMIYTTDISLVAPAARAGVAAAAADTHLSSSNVQRLQAYEGS
jgi:hypothetical protein